MQSTHRLQVWSLLQGLFSPYEREPVSRLTRPARLRREADLLDTRSRSQVPISTVQSARHYDVVVIISASEARTREVAPSITPEADGSAPGTGRAPLPFEGGSLRECGGDR